MSKLNAEKSYAILGLGLSGLATIEFLLQHGIKKIFVSELKTDPEIEKTLEKYKGQIEVELGIPHSDRCLNYDYLIVSPGISLGTAILQKARLLNKNIMPEVELAASQINKFIGITGTNGKSTTTAWIAHILAVPACGNIGLPFVQAILQESNKNYYACELSSFQLAHSNSLKPHIALITNITPDHISWHGTWEHYLQAKAKITKFQEADDWLLLPNYEPLNKINTKAQIFWIESAPKASVDKKNVIWLNKKQEIIIKERIVCKAYELPLPGQHNLENAMFTIAATYLAGIKLEEIRDKLLSFQGLEHRLEFIGELNGKKFFNDSKATNPESTIVALKAFAEPLVWLAGGRDKMTSLEALNEQVKKNVSTAIFYGEAADRFYIELNKSGFGGRIYKVNNLEEALSLALKAPEQIVLLSPACASFDQFKSFEERGKKFKELISALTTKF